MKKSIIELIYVLAAFVSPLWGQELMIDVGGDIALSSDTIVISGGNVYERSGDDWTFKQKLSLPDGFDINAFPGDVAISGDTIAVGASVNRLGSVFVFVKEDDNWVLQQQLYPEVRAEYDYFSQSVAISGDTIVVGAYLSNAHGNNSGAAYVFERTGNTWTEQQQLIASDASAGNFYGVSVAVFNNTIAIGAFGQNVPDYSSDAVYVYTRAGEVWSEQQILTASDDVEFARSVSLSGETLVVGACYDDELGTNSGSAYVFVRDGGVWSQEQKLTAADGTEGDRFGYSVSISGDAVLIGANADNHIGVNSGSAYVFTRRGSTWEQVKKLTSSDTEPNDYFGTQVAVYGDSLLVSTQLAYRMGVRTGLTYLFDGSSYISPFTYSLNTTAQTGGSILQSSEGTEFVIGESITLTAVGNRGYGLLNWGGDLVGTVNPQRILMVGNKMVEASFELLPAVIDTEPQSSSIVNGQSTTLRVTTTYATSYQWYKGNSGNVRNPIEGANTRKLTVSPASTTSYWVRVFNADDEPTDSITARVTVTEPDVTYYTLSIMPGEGGAIFVSPDIDSYEEGSVVTVTAEADSGFAFTGWSGDLSGTETTKTLTINADKSVSAQFILDPADIFLLDESNAFGDNWYRTWLGIVNINSWPWLFSESGWVYAGASGNANSGSWFYYVDSSLDCWLWASESIDPWVYCQPSGHEETWWYIDDSIEPDFIYFLSVVGDFVAVEKAF